jgi:hypothetical protein
MKTGAVKRPEYSVAMLNADTAMFQWFRGIVLLEQSVGGQVESTDRQLADVDRGIDGVWQGVELVVAHQQVPIRCRGHGFVRDAEEISHILYKSKCH